MGFRSVHRSTLLDSSERLRSETMLDLLILTSRRDEETQLFDVRLRLSQNENSNLNVPKLQHFDVQHQWELFISFRAVFN